MNIQPEILTWLIGSIIGVSLLVYCGYALFGDRSHGRRRCPKCAHEFGELPGTRCPECGYEAKNEKALLKPRRHWGQAAFRLILLLSVALVIRLRATGNDWLILVPDRALVWMIPMDGAQRDGSVVIELKRRLLHGSLSLAATTALIDRLQNGDSFAEPGTQVWDDRYGRLARVWGDRMENQDDPLLEDLLKTTPQVRLETPLFWPASAPVPARLWAKDYWPHGTEARVEARWSTGEVLANVAFRNYAASSRGYSFDLPPSETWPQMESGRVNIDIQTRRTTSDWNGASIPPRNATWSEWSSVRTYELAVTRPSDLNLQLTGTTNPELDALVKRIFQPGLRRFSGASRPFAIRFDTRVVGEENRQNIVFGVEVEILETPKGQEPIVRRRSRVWIHPGNGTGVQSGWEISEEDLEGLTGAFEETNQSTWTMRVRGERLLAERGIALMDGDVTAAQQFWNGEIEFPLPIHHEVSTPFIRRWFFESGPPRP